MERRYLEWIFAGMIILGVSGQNRVFAQWNEQSSSPVISPTLPAVNPAQQIPPPRVSPAAQERGCETHTEFGGDGQSPNWNTSACCGSFPTSLEPSTYV